MEHLGIVYTDIGTHHLTATMPVNSTTHQPMGLLHGGASVALAESVGSAASSMLVNPKTHAAVGLEINANHVRGVRSGLVTARAELLHAGRTSHIWDIKIQDEQARLVCVCRLTMAVLEKKEA